MAARTANKRAANSEQNFACELQKTAHVNIYDIAEARGITADDVVNDVNFICEQV